MKIRLPHLIAMPLACLMLLSSVSILAGCVKEDAPDTETSSGQNGTAGETSTEYVPDIAKKNYHLQRCRHRIQRRPPYPRRG